MEKLYARAYVTNITRASTKDSMNGRVMIRAVRTVRPLNRQKRLAVLKALKSIFKRFCDGLQTMTLL